MSETPATDTAKDSLSPDFERLVAAVDHLPEDHRAAVEPLLARVIESTKRRRRILGLVQDAMGQLRLDMKYLMFDLEATRRERDGYLHKLQHPDGDQ